MSTNGVLDHERPGEQPRSTNVDDLIQAGKAIHDSIWKKVQSHVKELVPHQLPEDFEVRLVFRISHLLRSEISQQIEAMQAEFRGDVRQLRQDLVGALEEHKQTLEADLVGKLELLLKNLPPLHAFVQVPPDAIRVSVDSPVPVINVPEQPPAQITVQAPPAKPTRKTISYDLDGRPQTILEEPVE